MRRMTWLEGLLLTVISGAALVPACRWTSKVLSEWKMAHDCPHPSHRIYDLGSEYICGECGYAVVPAEMDDFS